MHNSSRADTKSQGESYALLRIQFQPQGELRLEQAWKSSSTCTCEVLLLSFNLPRGCLGARSPKGAFSF